MCISRTHWNCPILYGVEVVEVLSMENVMAGVILLLIPASFLGVALYELKTPDDSAYWELLDSKVLLVHCSMPENATRHYLNAVRAYRAGDHAKMERELDLMRADWTKTCRFRLFAPDPQSSFARVSAYYEKLPLEQF